MEQTLEQDVSPVTSCHILHSWFLSGQSDVLHGAVDVGTQDLLFPSCHIGADSHCVDTAFRKMKIESYECKDLDKTLLTESSGTH